MNKLPYFPLYANDWLSSTKISLMSPAEEGAYVHLLCHMWNSPDCTLPDDDEALAVLSRLGPEWFNGSGNTLRRCFEVKGKKLTNSRLKNEREKLEYKFEKSRLGGINSGISRRNRKLQDEGGSKGVRSTQGSPFEHSDSDSDSKEEKELSGSPDLSPPETGDGKEHPKAPPVNHQALFGQIWKRYPMKDGKKEAFRHFKATVKTLEDFKAISKALDNYLQHLSLEQNRYKQPKNGKTWFNNWGDWVDWVEPETPEQREERAQELKRAEKELEIAQGRAESAREALKYLPPGHERREEEKRRLEEAEIYMRRIQKVIEKLRKEG